MKFAIKVMGAVVLSIAVLIPLGTIAIAHYKSSSKERTVKLRRMASEQQLKQISMIAAIYRFENGGESPPDMNALEVYDNPIKFFIAPSDAKHERVNKALKEHAKLNDISDYVLAIHASDKTLIAYEKLDLWGDGIVAAFFLKNNKGAEFTHADFEIQRLSLKDLDRIVKGR